MLPPINLKLIIGMVHLELALILLDITVVLGNRIMEIEVFFDIDRKLNCFFLTLHSSVS